MFTAEEIEDCDIFPKKLTAGLVIKVVIYIILMLLGSVLLYSFYSGRDFTSIITMENLKFGTDTYYLKKIMMLDNRYNYHTSTMEMGSSISTYDFINNYLTESVPISFKNQTYSWETNKWTDEYFNSKVANLMINVSRYEHKETDHLKKFIVNNNYTVNQYLNDLLNKTDPKYDYFWDDILPEKLMNDVSVPEFIRFMDLKSTRIWKGNGLSYSVPKYDKAEILHCQIQGKAEFIIAPALDRNAVYPYKKNAGPPNIAGISFYNPDMGRFPNSGNLFKIYFILEKGDCLFIPAYWWYQVDTYNEPNTYINFYFASHSRYVDIIMKGIEEDMI